MNAPQRRKARGAGTRKSTLFEKTAGPEAIAFARQLSKLGVAFFTARPTGDEREFGARPDGWSQRTPETNTETIQSWRPGWALQGQMNDCVACIDVDPRNGGDVDAVRALLTELDVRVYAEVATPGGGVHFYVAGHPDLPSVAADEKRTGLDGYPGVEVLSHGRAPYLPGTRRPKREGRGYEIVFDELDKLIELGDEDDCGERLAAWVAGHRWLAKKDREWLQRDDAEPWDGTPPDARQTAYLHAALRDETATVASTSSGGRNSALYVAALKLGSYVTGAGLDAGQVRAALRTASEQNGLADEDGSASVDATIRSGLRAGGQHPKAVPAQRVDDPRPELDISNGADALDALRESVGIGPLSGLFLRGDTVVRVPRIGEEGYAAPPEGEHDSDGPARVVPLDGKGLRYVIQARYWTYKLTGTKDAKVKTHTAPTVPTCEDVLRAALHGECPNLPRLDGVMHTPLVRTDGTVLDAPGYDAATGLLYLPDRSLDVCDVPRRPTRRQIEEARERLLYVIQDFSFTSEADRANYLGLLLTPLLRLLAPGPRPLGVIHAHMAGSGKTLLCKIIEILYGAVLRSEPSTESEEFRKNVTTLLLRTTAPVVVFDNVRSALGGAVLEKLLTDGSWSDRILGGNEDTGRLANDRLWLATGNNVSVRGDMSRRTIWVNIDPDEPRPWETEREFAEPRLLDYVREHREELLAALLTLVRGWVVNGARKRRTTRQDDYAVWSATVGGILDHAGVDGAFWSPGTDRAPVSSDDDEWRRFLVAVHAAFGRERFTAREVIEAVGQARGFIDIDAEQVGADLRECLPGDLGDKIERSPTGATKSLGKWFGNHDGRWAGDYVARAAGEDGHGTKLWRVQKQDQQ